ncbi:AAA family ATPase [Desulfococcaceae bacterium HSG8]|nr:AAA family ATPase [Desulfococcaceae bacterium HSG8]
MYNTNKPSPFYLAKVTFKDIQGFEYLSADFLGESGDVRMCSMLLGDNSSGKTAFLRCLALGICDGTSAAGLMRYLQGNLVQHGKQSGTIAVELIRPGNRLHSYLIVTEIEPVPVAEQLTKKFYHISNNGSEIQTSARDFPLDNLFVCAYGAGRVSGQTTDKHEYYRIIEAVSNLFHYVQPMQHPELSLRRIISAAQKNVHEAEKIQAGQETLFRFQKLIEKLFMFEDQDTVELTEKGIEVVSAKKHSSLLTHGDGYKNTAAWVLDFITWNMLAGRSLDPDNISGIVLIDEIEQHLHPRWQRHIVKLLREAFPKVQFIATTHSPLCAAGTADLNDDENQLLRLHKKDSEQTELNIIPSLRGFRADQVLTSEAFGLATTRNPDLAEKLKAFGELYLKASRDKYEEQKFLELRDFLDEYLPESAEDSETRLMQQKLKKMLKDIGIVSNVKGKDHD